MAGEQGSYPITKVNKLGRLAKRGAYDYQTIHSIIDEAPILHVSFIDPEQEYPVTLPMLGCTGVFGDDVDEDGKRDIYVHGYVSGRMFRKSKEGGEEGLKVTVAASLMDGLVLALAPFHNSCNYRSALAHGTAHPVTSSAETLHAMTLITNNMLPTRWERSRNPATPAELKSTSVLRITIETASAKIRTGGPSDDRKDLKDEELRGRVWTGVVPCWTEWGAPVEGEMNGAGEVEGYIEGWRGEVNRRNREGAYGAVEKKG